MAFLPLRIIVFGNCSLDHLNERILDSNSVDVLQTPENLGAPQAWEDLVAGGMEIHQVPGDHTSMMQEPHVRELAEKLTGVLEQAQADR